MQLLNDVNLHVQIISWRKQSWKTLQAGVSCTLFRLDELYEVLFSCGLIVVCGLPASLQNFSQLRQDLMEDSGAWQNVIVQSSLQCVSPQLDMLEAPHLLFSEHLPRLNPDTLWRKLISTTCTHSLILLITTHSSWK